MTSLQATHLKADLNGDELLGTPSMRCKEKRPSGLAVSLADVGNIAGLSL